MVTPDKVAKKALKDAKKCKDISIYSLFTKNLTYSCKASPTAYDDENLAETAASG